MVVAAERTASGRSLQPPDRHLVCFQEANPGIKVVFGTTSDEGYAAQLAAAFSSGEVPDVVTHLPSFSIHTYYAAGLVEPMNDVIDAVGPDDFYEGANDVYKVADGNFVATGIGNVAANMLWLRTFLLTLPNQASVPEVIVNTRLESPT